MKTREAILLLTISSVLWGLTGSSCVQNELCIVSNGKKQPLLFNAQKEIVYPTKSCHTKGKGEVFVGAVYIGCSGNRRNFLQNAEGKKLANGRELVFIDPDLAGDYQCRFVSRSTVIKRNGTNDLFDIVFLFKNNNVKHIIYSIKWDAKEHSPVWVRHVPTSQYPEATLDVTDTGIRAPWRFSKKIFGKNVNPRPFFRLAAKEHGMSRGHLAPAADFMLASERWSTFQLANVVPQPQDHNNGEWKSIEERVRRLTKVLFIETGPIYPTNGKKFVEIIPVPTGMYKKVVMKNLSIGLFEESYF